MDINRTITQGEPINDIIIYENDIFDFVMTLFDDLGAAMADALEVQIIGMMEPGSNVRFTSGTVVISNGIATVPFPVTFTSVKGDYRCKIKVANDISDPTSLLTVGTFRLLIREAT